MVNWPLTGSLEAGRDWQLSHPWPGSTGPACCRGNGQLWRPALSLVCSSEDSAPLPRSQEPPNTRRCYLTPYLQ